MADKRISVVFVAQTPPPLHGQSVANQLILEGTYTSAVLHHVPLDFSGELSDVGRFRPAKILGLFRVVRRLVAARTESGPGALLLYAVGLKNRVGLIRDIIVLLIARPLFAQTVFHVHSGGVDEVTGSNSLLRRLARRAYGGADGVIYLDPVLEQDGGGLPAPRQRYYLPYGVAAPDLTPSMAPRSRALRVLFVGNLYETKGTHVLVDAVEAANASGAEIEVDFVGASPGPDVSAALEQRITSAGLTDRVRLHGVLNGAAKWQCFADADVFCLPTHYEAEAMPVAIVEAMSAGLPVVSTSWRAIPSLVADGDTGFIVEPHDVAALAERLQRLASDPTLRSRMAAAARARFEERHSVERFRSGLEAVIARVGGPGD